MTRVTRRDMLSIFRFSPAHKPGCHRVPSDHRSPRSPSLHAPCALAYSSSPVSQFEYEAALRWLSRKSTTWQSCLHVRENMIEECARRCQRITSLFHPPPTHDGGHLPDLFTHYAARLIVLSGSSINLNVLTRNV